MAGVDDTHQETAVAAKARVETKLAARYLTQLCKHFEHRVPAVYGDGQGRLKFTAGICTLAADEGALSLTAAANDGDSLAQLEDIVARHLVRFAFRETLTINWEPV